MLHFGEKMTPESLKAQLDRRGWAISVKEKEKGRGNKVTTQCRDGNGIHLRFSDSKGCFLIQGLVL